MLQGLHLKYKITSSSQLLSLYLKFVDNLIVAMNGFRANELSILQI